MPNEDDKIINEIRIQRDDNGHYHILLANSVRIPSYPRPINEIKVEEDLAYEIGFAIHYREPNNPEIEGFMGITRENLEKVIRCVTDYIDRKRQTKPSELELDTSGETPKSIPHKPRTPQHQIYKGTKGPTLNNPN
jgi:hypothetical protein